MNRVAIVCALLISFSSEAQELFTATEPASNRPAGSIGIRLDNSIMDERNTSRLNYHFIPGLAVGVTKKLMISGSLYFSNRREDFRYEGGSVYAKYRFLSKDIVQEHFRMSGFARISYNNSDIHQEEIDLYGHNTGIEAGIVATQLLRRFALSSSVAYVLARDNGGNNKFIYGLDKSKAVNYTFSVGKLILPREYRDYKQKNLNLMIEFMSQFNLGSGRYFMDIMPTVQVIVNSQARVDLGYRKQLKSTLVRTAPDGLFIRLEYNFFNAFRQ